MAGTTEIFVFKDALIVLGTAAVVAPVVHRLKISPILGFLVVGAALGPHGLGRLAEHSRAIDWFTVTGETADRLHRRLRHRLPAVLHRPRTVDAPPAHHAPAGVRAGRAAGRRGRAADRPRRALARPAARCGADHRHLPGAFLDRHRHGAAVGPAPHDVDDRPHQLRHPARPGPCRGAAAVPDQRARRKRRGRLGGPGRRRGAGRGRASPSASSPSSAGSC